MITLNCVCVCVSQCIIYDQLICPSANTCVLSLHSNQFPYGSVCRGFARSRVSVCNNEINKWIHYRYDFHANAERMIDAPPRMINAKHLRDVAAPRWVINYMRARASVCACNAATRKYWPCIPGNQCELICEIDITCTAWIKCSAFIWLGCQQPGSGFTRLCSSLRFEREPRTQDARVSGLSNRTFITCARLLVRISLLPFSGRRWVFNNDLSADGIACTVG